MLLTFIGLLPNSSAAQAAYTICYAQLFSFVTWASFALRSASATVMGQNIGAGKIARGKAAVGVAAVLGLVWAAAIGSLFWLVPDFLLGLFDATDEPIFTYASTLLRILAFSGLVLAPTLALTGGIQGAGQTKIPMFIAFATQIVLLLSICSFFYWQGTLTTTKIWLAIFTVHAVRLMMTWAVFRTENWAHTKVELKRSASLAQKET
jgi:Na+-driven multidrug efflux pump